MSISLASRRQLSNKIWLWCLSTVLFMLFT